MQKQTAIVKIVSVIGRSIDQVSRVYNFQVDNKDNLIWHLHNTAILRIGRNYRQSLSYLIKKGNTIKNFQNIFPRLFQRWKRGIEHYLEYWIWLQFNESQSLELYFFITP